MKKVLANVYNLWTNFETHNNSYQTTQLLLENMYGKIYPYQKTYLQGTYIDSPHKI